MCIRYLNSKAAGTSTFAGVLFSYDILFFTSIHQENPLFPVAKNGKIKAIWESMHFARKQISKRLKIVLNAEAWDEKIIIY